MSKKRTPNLSAALTGDCRSIADRGLMSVDFADRRLTIDSRVMIDAQSAIDNLNPQSTVRKSALTNPQSAVDRSHLDSSRVSPRVAAARVSAAAPKSDVAGWE